MSDNLTIAGRQFHSRLFVGTGKYRNAEEMNAALEASGCEIVTVSAVTACASQVHRHHYLSTRRASSPILFDDGLENVTYRCKGCGLEMKRAFKRRSGAWQPIRHIPEFPSLQRYR